MISRRAFFGLAAAAPLAVALAPRKFHPCDLRNPDPKAALAWHLDNRMGPGDIIRRADIIKTMDLKIQIAQRELVRGIEDCMYRFA